MLIGSLHHILHWPTQGGYNFVSGPLSDITLVTAFVGTMYIFLRKHNCHVHRCWRLQWHAHPDHGHLVCKQHHPHGRLVTAEGAPSMTEDADDAGPVDAAAQPETAPAV
ncbi:MAG TPA: hypothetical protein VGM80_14425 [Gaiellaceae bacterium]